MKIKYNKEIIRQIINDLSELTGVSMAFLDTNYMYVCSHTNINDFCTAIQNSGSRSKCLRSDEIVIERSKKSRQFESHICHAGLYDAAMPIIKNGIFAGVIIMGRVRLQDSYPDKEFFENSHLKKLYYQLPELTQKQILALQSLFPNILFQNGIYIEQDDILERICEYIEAHINENINLRDICTNFQISKNKLYDAFRQSFDTTVNDYIINCRIEKAKKLLSDTDLPIYIISESVGIDNYPYFCRIFKRKSGVTPSEYRGR